MSYLLGIDLGSSSIKASLVEVQTGRGVASATSPDGSELEILSPHPGHAEQHPQEWYRQAQVAVRGALDRAQVDPSAVIGVGIAYQMHGLVCLDRQGKVLRPAILWCDSRAVPYGEQALSRLGFDKCMSRLLNAPGNFTGMKLAWVRDQEPEIFAKIATILLPGDWLAYAMTGERTTTASGLSEGILWDYQESQVAEFVLEDGGFDRSWIPEILPTFARHGGVSQQCAKDFGLVPGTPLTYRAGDQPNNALALGATQPGDVAANAGTSGVIYGITDQVLFDGPSRVNTFLHVNHQESARRLGVLFCLNGCGCAYSWLRKQLGVSEYESLNRLASEAPAGSEGLLFYPFGNGVERLFGTKPGFEARFSGLNFHRHQSAHLARAVQEGVLFSLRYGIEIMEPMGLRAQRIRVGDANLFRSDLFSQGLANLSGASIEMFDTDGAQGAARAAGVEAGVYDSVESSVSALERLKLFSPQSDAIEEAYHSWKRQLLRWQDALSNPPHEELS